MLFVGIDTVALVLDTAGRGWLGGVCLPAVLVLLRLGRLIALWPWMPVYGRVFVKDLLIAPWTGCGGVSFRFFFGELSVPSATAWSRAKANMQRIT